MELKRGVYTRGPVESWLNQVTSEMIKELRDSCQEAYDEYNPEPYPRTEWILCHNS